MRPVELLRSTPFRLALTFAGMCLVLFVLTGIFTVRLAEDQLSTRLDDLITETVASVTATYQPDDLEDLLSSVNSSARVGQRDRVVLLADLAGNSLAGNVSLADTSMGWQTVSGLAFGLPPQSRYRAFSTTLGVYRLVVGMSFDDTDAIISVLATSLTWAGLGVMLAAIGLGILLAMQAHRRIAAVAHSMARVGEGDLSARLPVSRSGDDIDRLSGQINAALSRLSASVDGMRQVSSDIAHDLRTPLNRIALAIDAASEKIAAQKDATAELEQAQEECFRVNKTFDALLRIAQIEAGARRLRFTRLQLLAPLASVADAYAAVAEDCGHSFEFAVGEDLDAPVFGDMDLLVQMFANLVENSIRHCPPGSSIRIEADSQTTRILVRVRDNGPGIAEQHREKAFQRLFRLDEARSSEGSGLGLSLVKAIAELHGGKVLLCDNRPGLDVVVELPRSDATPRHGGPTDNST